MCSGGEKPVAVPTSCPPNLSAGRQVAGGGSNRLCPVCVRAYVPMRLYEAAKLHASAPIAPYEHLLPVDTAIKPGEIHTPVAADCAALPGYRIKQATHPSRLFPVAVGTAHAGGIALSDSAQCRNRTLFRSPVAEILDKSCNIDSRQHSLGYGPFCIPEHDAIEEFPRYSVV